MQLLNVSHFHHVCSWGAYCALVFVCFIRYRTFVSEDAGPNTLVATVLAKDPDGDGITYKITTGNEEGNFVIDNQKGLITGLFVVFIWSLMLNILLTTACFQLHMCIFERCYMIHPSKAILICPTLGRLAAPQFIFCLSKMVYSPCPSPFFW